MDIVIKRVEQLITGDVIHLNAGCCICIKDIFPSKRNDGTYIIQTKNGSIYEFKYDDTFELIFRAR